MDLKRIEQLIELMRRSGVTQLSLELPDYKVSIKRSAEGEQVTESPQEPPQAVVEPPVPQAGQDEMELEALESVPVVSPVVGVFHNGGVTNPREMVNEGDRVQRGQLLAAIEAMKVPNELRAPVSGMIAKLLVEDGAPVQYGQTLMLIQPEEGGEDDGESQLGLA